MAVHLDFYYVLNWATLIATSVSVKVENKNYGVRVPVSFGMPILNVCAVPFNQVGYHTSHRQQKKRHLIIVSAI